MPPSQTTIRCSNCGQPAPAVIRSVIDVQSDPQGKELLLTNRLNSARCPACGFANKVITPVLYHDASKSLLIVCVPGETLRGQKEEKVVGDLMNELNRVLPKESFRAYMFNPKRSLTLQGMIDIIMEGDGITPDMLASQKKRLELLQEMLSATSQEALETLIADNDAVIDAQFFQTLRLAGERLMEDPQNNGVIQRLMAVQDMLVAKSSFGATLMQQQQAKMGRVQEVVADIEKLGENATRADFLNIVREYAGDEDKLQGLVGLMRPVFDEDFFQELTLEIGRAPAEDREKLERTRDNLIELTQLMDAQVQQGASQTIEFLQMLVNSPQPQELIQANLELIDDEFMSILVANLQEAEKRGDQALHQRLQGIYGLVVQVLQSRMSPELRFLNALLSVEDEPQLQELLQQAKQFGPELMESVDAVEQMTFSRGQTTLSERIGVLKGRLQEVLNSNA